MKLLSHRSMRFITPFNFTDWLQISYLMDHKRGSAIVIIITVNRF